MANCFLVADEAGNFDFSRNRGASRYFILTTVTIPDAAAGLDLIRLRHELRALSADTSTPRRMSKPSGTVFSPP